MSDQQPTLNDRQIMMLTHLTSKVLRDPNSLTEALKDLPGTLKSLGADDNDVKAIGAYVTHLSTTIKANNRVGYW